MKTLKEHNKQRTELHRNVNSNEPVMNGIACPKCGSELYDTHPNMILASNPPKKNINCEYCEYTGYRVA